MNLVKQEHLERTFLAKAAHYPHIVWFHNLESLHGDPDQAPPSKKKKEKKTRDVCKTLTSRPFSMKHLPRSSPYLVHEKTKSFGSIPSTHPVHDETKSFGSTPLQYRMAIYIKSTILKLKNSRIMLEIVFLCTLNMLNFKRLALIATEM